MPPPDAVMRGQMGDMFMEHFDTEEMRGHWRVVADGGKYAAYGEHAAAVLDLTTTDTPQMFYRYSYDEEKEWRRMPVTNHIQVETFLEQKCQATPFEDPLIRSLEHMCVQRRRHGHTFRKHDVAQRLLDLANFIASDDDNNNNKHEMMQRLAAYVLGAHRRLLQQEGRFVSNMPAEFYDAIADEQFVQLFREAPAVFGPRCCEARWARLLRADNVIMSMADTIDGLSELIGNANTSGAILRNPQPFLSEYSYAPGMLLHELKERAGQYIPAALLAWPMETLREIGQMRWAVVASGLSKDEQGLVVLCMQLVAAHNPFILSIAAMLHLQTMAEDYHAAFSAAAAPAASSSQGGYGSSSSRLCKHLHAVAKDLARLPKWQKPEHAE